MQSKTGAVKDEQVPTARVRGSLPPLGARSAEQPDGFVMPLYSLYSTGQVALATFLGTPLAGCWLVSRNFKKLGSRKSAWAILALGVAWAAGLCGLAVLEKLPGIVSILSIPFTVLVMRGVQGRELDRHASLGGRTTSWGWAVGGAFACLGILCVAVIGAVFAWLLLTQAPSIAAPSGGEVAYLDGATEADARRVRDALAELDYFNGAYTVQVSRDGERWVVAYVVTDEGLRDPEMGQAFGDLSDAISRKAFAGAPVDTVLLDDEAKPHHRIAFEERVRTLPYGKDELRFRNLGEEQARALHDVLAEHAYFEDQGRTVMASRKLRVEIEIGTVDYTPTPLDNLLNEALCRELSRAIGNAPVDLVFGNFEGKVSASYRWPELGPAPVRAGDGTLVFFRDGGTKAEAEHVAQVVSDGDDGAALYVIVLRDETFEPARAIVAVVTEDPASVAVQHTLHRLAEPLSQQAFGNTPVDIRLVDEQLALKLALSWEKRPRGKK